MEITIKHNHGQITMREPFFPCSLGKLKRLILPLLLEDPQGETVREQMATYCEEESRANYEEAKRVFNEGQREIEYYRRETDKDACRKRYNKKVKHLLNLSVKYKKNAEVIRK